jgi:hypothetical protein
MSKRTSSLIGAQGVKAIKTISVWAMLVIFGGIESRITGKT